MQHRRNGVKGIAMRILLPVFTVICFPLLLAAQQESLGIKGLVENDKGEPLEGISLEMKNESTGNVKTTLTDVKGVFYFSFPAEKGDFLFTASGIGFATQSIQRKNLDASKQESLYFSLVPTAASLNDVVVVGYGKQKRRDVTGAVTSVPRQRLEMVPNLNIAQAIQGSAAGVTIQQTSGGAASGESIMIRGRNSILASNDPLIVLDGVPYGGQLRDINVNDVQSIEILKDASAAAIYGSRGSNGVILVTTKAGNKGKPEIMYDGKISFQDYTKLPDIMNGEEFYRFKEFREPGKITATEQKNYDKGKWVNWADLALRKGFMHQHNLSVSGGFNNTSYYIGGALLDVKGLAITDQYRRITSRINIDTKITPWLTIGTRTQLSFENQDGAELDWNLVFRKNPLINPYTQNGAISIYPWPEFQDIRNPLEVKNILDQDRAFQLVANNYALVEFPFLDGLSFRLNSGIRKRFADKAGYAGRNTKQGLEAEGFATTSRGNDDNIVLENILSYNKSFGPHTVFATALYSFEENKSSVNSLQAQGFPNDFLTWYASAQADLLTPEYTFGKTVLLSQMARLNYSYDSRYMLTLTGRRDGFSGFGSSSKWGFFPSVAVGWNLAKENFLSVDDVFSELKLRASIGLNGNQAVGAYESISRLVEENMVSLGTFQPGYIPSKLGQDNLGWEATRTINIGVDAGLLSGRVSASLNLFKSNTSDLLLNRSISPVHGINTITQNIGETENNGIELTLNATVLKAGAFTWNASGNIAYVKNKIVSLYGELDEKGNEIDDLANAWFIGKPILVNYDYAWAGVWQLGEEAEAAKWGSKPGFVKLLDADGDGKLTGADRQVIGQQDPKITWGMNHSFGYKGLQLDVFLYGMDGITRQNQQMADAPVSSEVRRNTINKNWWTPENPTNEWYMNNVNAHIMGGITSNVYENASFTRVKDLALSYNLPQHFLKKNGISKLRVYVTGRNLFTFTNWRAMDPELNHGRGAVPLQKEWVFGATIGL